MEIRTARGKLVGVLDEGTRVFSYKDRNKVMQIEIPAEGLKLRYTPGDGIVEEVCIQPKAEKSMLA